MRLLIDANALLWWLADSPRLGPKARAALERAEEAHVSAATLWEIVIKINLGKLEADAEALVEALPRQGFLLLPIAPRHVLRLRDLPPHHRDPFDRLLIAQAMSENLTLISADGAFGAYGVDLMDAAR